MAHPVAWMGLFLLFRGQVMMLAAAFRLGTGWETMVFVVSIAWVGFFAAHWEEFHTHRMILGPLNGPNEGIYVIAGVQILTAVYGSEVWVTEWRTFRTLSVFLLGFAGTAITIVLNVKNSETSPPSVRNSLLSHPIIE